MCHSVPTRYYPAAQRSYYQHWAAAALARPGWPAQTLFLLPPACIAEHAIPQELRQAVGSAGRTINKEQGDINEAGETAGVLQLLLVICTLIVYGLNPAQSFVHPGNTTVRTLALHAQPGCTCAADHLGETLFQRGLSGVPPCQHWRMLCEAACSHRLPEEARTATCPQHLHSSSRP